MTAAIMTAAIDGRFTRRRTDGPFLAVSGLVFATSLAATILWCIGMPVLCGMSMPGGWTMSMAWMRLPGQSWLGAGFSFLAMWTVMMAAMMLPSLIPMLLRYRQTIEDAGKAQLDLLTALAGLGYFCVWVALGVAVFPLGTAFAAAAMAQPMLAQAVPPAAGAVVLMAGVMQFTTWKARRLACCRAAPCTMLSRHHEAMAAWRHGLNLGFDCTICCAGPTAVLLTLGVMDLRAMAVIALAITLERLLPGGVHVARLTGAAAVTAGLLMIAQAAGLA